jgi:hypothetical protein
MNTKGLKYGDIASTFSRDLQMRIESIINAKSKRRRPYYLLIMVKEGYGGPLALGNNNELLHGRDSKRKRSRGPTKTCDFSGLKVAHCVIQVLEPWQVPNVPLISNILMKVDNMTGLVERLYALPPDRPVVDRGPSVDSETVARDAKGMPIVYGTN